MTLRFPTYPDRPRVAAMLEAPVRLLLADSPGDARAEVQAILDELDRMDTARRARLALDQARAEYDHAIIQQYVSVTDAPADALCSERTYGRHGYSSRTGKTHRAKVLIDGTPYCGTHRVRAERDAQINAKVAHRAGYHPDPALQAIVNADRDVYAERIRKARLP